jgi:hypothetical protein
VKRNVALKAKKKLTTQINAKFSYVSSADENNVKKMSEEHLFIYLIGNVSQFKYLGKTVRNQNAIREEIKRRLNSGNACYHSVRNFVFSSAVEKRKN